MMENPMMMKIRTLVEAIHSTPTQAVLFFSGGASQALGWLASVPGASNTLLEVIVPYSRMSMIQLLGKAISDACKVSSSMAFVPDLAEGEVSDVSEELFDENQELEQLIHGKICFKVFPFSSVFCRDTFSQLEKGK